MSPNPGPQPGLYSEASIRASLDEYREEAGKRTAEFQDRLKRCRCPNPTPLRSYFGLFVCICGRLVESNNREKQS